MKYVIAKKRKQIIMIISFIIFIIFVQLFYNNQLTIIDNFIYSLIKPFICKPLTIFFRLITELGDIYGIGIILLIILYKNKQIFINELANMSFVVILNQILKRIFIRPRPDYGMLTLTGYSFPSGHSMASVAFYGYLAYLIHKSKIKHKKTYIGILILIVTLIGISRIYLGAHYATDVIAGFMISLSYLLLFIIITMEDKHEKNKRHHHNF